MREFVLLLTLLCLAGCGDKSDTTTNDQLAKLIKVSVETTCTVSPSVIDIAAALAAGASGGVGAVVAGPVGTIVKSWTKNICDQWETKHKTQAATDDGCIATVNGVCIRKGD